MYLSKWQIWQISIIENSVVTIDKNIEAIKTVSTKTVPTKSTSTNFYILLAFLVITTTLLIAVNYLLLCDKILSKRKSLLCDVTNDKLKETLY